jgi:hypothetical protein
MPDHAHPTKEEIVALEKSYWDAMKKKDGRRTAETLRQDKPRNRGAEGDEYLERQDGEDD